MKALLYSFAAIGAFSLLAVAYFFFLVLRYTQYEAVLNSDVHASPHHKARTIAEFDRGDLLRGTRQYSKDGLIIWYEVDLGDGKRGWVDGFAIKGEPEIVAK